MLRAEPAEFFCFYPSLVTFWGALVANDANNRPSPFYLLHIFSGGTGATMFLEGYNGATHRHAPVRSGSGAVSGGYRKRRER